MHTQIYAKNIKERPHLEDLGVDEKALLKWILKSFRLTESVAGCSE
jgi:hypothetical protein